MAEIGTQLFLGTTELNYRSFWLGSTQTLINPVATDYYPPFELGQQRLGGYVFYVTGSYPRQSVLIAATEQATPASLSWGCSGTNVTTSTGLFSGSQNTQNILIACSETNIGARYCDNLQSNDFTDWYLPSQDELAQLYTNRTYVPGIVSSSNSFYMSSTQGTNNTNYCSQDFGTGTQTNIRSKGATENNRVIAIRQIVQ